MNRSLPLNLQACALVAALLLGACSPAPGQTTLQPSPVPSERPVLTAAPEPTAAATPTPEPTTAPEPTEMPTPKPTEAPTIEPTAVLEMPTKAIEEPGPPNGDLPNEWQAWIRTLAFSPDATLLAVAADNHVFVYQTDSQRVVTSFSFEAFREYGGAQSLAFSPDARLLAVAGFEGPVTLWDVATGSKVRELPGTGTLAFSPDGSLLAIAQGDLNLRELNQIQFWDPATGELVRTLDRDQRSYPPQIAFSADGSLLAVAGQNNVLSTAEVWRLADGTMLGQRTGIDGYATCLAPLPDTTFVLGLSGAPSERIGTDAALLEAAGPSASACSTDVFAGYEDDSQLLVLSPVGGGMSDSMLVGRQPRAVALAQDTSWVAIGTNHLMLWNVAQHELIVLGEPAS